MPRRISDGQPTPLEDAKDSDLKLSVCDASSKEVRDLKNIAQNKQFLAKVKENSLPFNDSKSSGGMESSSLDDGVSRGYSITIPTTAFISNQFLAFSKNNLSNDFHLSTC